MAAVHHLGFLKRTDRQPTLRATSVAVGRIFAVHAMRPITALTALVRCMRVCVQHNDVDALDHQHQLVVNGD